VVVKREVKRVGTNVGVSLYVRRWSFFALTPMNILKSADDNSFRTPGQLATLTYE
jgi:hypothetical protein